MRQEPKRSAKKTYQAPQAKRDRETTRKVKKRVKDRIKYMRKDQPLPQSLGSQNYLPLTPLSSSFERGENQPLGQRPNVLGAVQNMKEICKRVKPKMNIEKTR
jgi:hypothetical protein